MAFKKAQIPAVSLYSSLSSAGTSMIVSPYPVDLNGNKITMTELGSTPQLTIDPKVLNSEEIIGFTTIIDNGNNTASLLGLSRDLASSALATPGTGKQHGAGAIIVFSWNPQDVARVAALENDQTFSGLNTFLQFPITPSSAPSTNYQAANKKYVDDTSTFGAPDANTVTKGIVQEATASDINSGTQAGSTGAELMVNPFYLAASKYGTQLPSSDQKAALAGTSGTPSVSNKYITNADASATPGAGVVARGDGSGLLNDWVSFPTKVSETAGESIAGATLPQAVFVAGATRESYPIVDIIKAVTMYTTSGSFYIGTSDFISQTFNTGSNNRLNGLTCVMNGSSSGQTITLKLYAVDGNHKPTGSAIATATGSLGANNYKYLNIQFSSAVTVSTSTEYAFVISGNGGGGDRSASLYDSTTTNPGYSWYSSNSGSTWTGTGSNTPFVCRVYGYVDEAFTTGRVYAANSVSMNRFKFNGFAVTTATAGNSIKIQTNGVVPGFTGLTQGSNYYLQDNGTIGTGFGTIETLVGVAISATELLIRTNPNELLYSELYWHGNFWNNINSYDNFPVPNGSQKQMVDFQYIVRSSPYIIGDQMFLDNKVTSINKITNYSTYPATFSVSRSNGILTVTVNTHDVGEASSYITVYYYKN